MATMSLATPPDRALLDERLRKHHLTPDEDLRGPLWLALDFIENATASYSRIETELRKARATIDRQGDELGRLRTLLGHADLQGTRVLHVPITEASEERGCPDGTCLADPRCRNRAEMRANHGTPDEFELAIMRAAPELYVAEADRTVTRYRANWAAASEPDAATQRALNSELAAMGCDPASATQAEFKRALWSAMKRIELDAMMKHIELDLQTPIGAPSLAIAEQFDAEARAASEDPGELGDIESVELDIPPMPVQLAEHRRRAAVDLWPGSGLPPLLSTTRARIEQWKKRQSTTPGAETYDFTPEQEAEAAEQAERFQGLDDSDRE